MAAPPSYDTAAEVQSMRFEGAPIAGFATVSRY